MLRHSFALIAVITFLFAGFPRASAAPVISRENEELLEQLDMLLLDSERLESAREMKIELLKKRAAMSTDNEERFWIVKDIFDEYKIFDADSALAYGRLSLDLAQSLNRPDLQNQLYIVTSYTLAGIGLLDESLEQLSLVDTDALPLNAKVDYMGQQVYLLTHIEQFKNINPVVQRLPDESQAILDSIARIIEPSHPEYNYYIGYRALGSKEDAQAALEIILPHIPSLDLNSQEDAKLLWIVARLYAVLQNRERQIHYLILSAITDMNIGNREIASLEEISGIMEEEGDLSRAYNYIQHCLQCAEKYKNRVRALRVASLEALISKKYQDKFIEMQKRTSIYLWISIGLALVLLLSTIFIYRQRRKLAKSYEKINVAKDQLTDRLAEQSETYSKLAETYQQMVRMSDELKDANERLADSDYVKVKCIGKVFALCSQYINKMEENRKAYARLLKTNSFDKALRMAENPETAQKELKDFHEQFDNIFLDVYPDFVTDFNALLNPDDPIIPKNKDGLNTELRIYALVRLGITDSVTIAEVLHCSVQTVYNKRMKVRNKAIVPKDNFVEIVKNLGKTSRSHG